MDSFPSQLLFALRSFERKQREAARREKQAQRSRRTSSSQDLDDDYIYSEKDFGR